MKCLKKRVEVFKFFQRNCVITKSLSRWLCTRACFFRFFFCFLHQLTARKPSPLGPGGSTAPYTNPFAIFDPREFSRGPKTNFSSCLGIPKQLEELVFRLRQNPGDQRSQTGLYCLNTNPFAIFDPREFSRGPKTNFSSCLGITDSLLLID